MGDRSNVLIINYAWHDESADRSVDPTHPGVFIYSHWLGEGLYEVVREALARGIRWTDTSYLTRIIADHVSAACGGPGSDLGMGISTGIDDNEYPILVLDPRRKQVWLTREGDALRGAKPIEDRRLSFADFVAQGAKSLFEGEATE